MEEDASFDVRRVTWTKEEDALLQQLVKTHGARSWTAIASALTVALKTSRNGKSCRLRWHNQLSPSLKHEPFTQAEEALIISLQAEVGNRWATISKHLPGRTDNSVKNLWNSKLKRLALARGGGEGAARGGAPRGGSGAQPPSPKPAGAHHRRRGSHAHAQAATPPQPPPAAPAWVSDLLRARAAGGEESESERVSERENTAAPPLPPPPPPPPLAAAPQAVPDPHASMHRRGFVAASAALWASRVAPQPAAAAAAAPQRLPTIPAGGALPHAYANSLLRDSYASFASAFRSPAASPPGADAARGFLASTPSACGAGFGAQPAAAHAMRPLCGAGMRRINSTELSALAALVSFVAR